jgi:hypothetical protein
MRKNARRCRPTLETLESRQVPTVALGNGGVLVIQGTPGDDRVIVRQDQNANTLTVNDNGVSSTFAASSVTRIAVFLGDGNDWLDACNVRMPVTAFGGNGNDTLIGGLADDALFGEAGADRLIGNRGRDYLNGGAGMDVIRRGRWDNAYRDPNAAYYPDAGDGAALAMSRYLLTPGSPQSTITARAQTAGEVTLESLLVYSPAYAPVTVYSITVAGDFRGVGALRVTRSQPNQTDDASIAVPATVRVNADGSRTLMFVTPSTVPTRSAVQYQVRGDLVPNGLPIDLALRNVEVAGPAANLEWRARFRWNVA